MNTAPRFLWVDISKGIAIIAVVLLHINFQFYESKYVPLTALLGSLWHVPVFFLLGGFFLKEEKLLQTTSFIKGKIKSLYYLLLYLLNSSYKCNGIHINNLFKFFVWCEVSKSFTRSII